MIAAIDVERRRYYKNRFFSQKTRSLTLVFQCPYHRIIELCGVAESETLADVVVVARLVRGLVALGPRRRLRRGRRPDAQRRARGHQLRHYRVPVHVPERHTPAAAAHYAHPVEIVLPRGQQQQPAGRPVPV